LVPEGDRCIRGDDHEDYPAAVRTIQRPSGLSGSRRTELEGSSFARRRRARAGSFEVARDDTELAMTASRFGAR
jgi:hypothetical protein